MFPVNPEDNTFVIRSTAPQPSLGGRRNARQHMNLIVGGTTHDDFSTLIQVLSTHAHMFEFEHKLVGSKHHVFFAHSMGSKWSSFLNGSMHATRKEV